MKKILPGAQALVVTVGAPANQSPDNCASCSNCNSTETSETPAEAVAK